MNEDRKEKIVTFTLKANQSLRSAALLLQHGDPGGAGSRAYYASFDAGRAALTATLPDFEPEDTKTHGSLIGKVGLHLARPGLIAPENGRALNRIQELRLLADYRTQPLTVAEATTSLTLAGRVVVDCTSLVEAKLEMKLADMIARRPDLLNAMTPPKPS